MYELFLEIAYEAEVDTKEDPELRELALEVCNENRDTRATAIKELQKMVFDRGQCSPFRIDDEFMLRFLRSKNYVVPRAHKLLVRYCTFREQYKQLYEGVDLWGLAKVKNAFESNMYNHPKMGRILILKFGKWDPNELIIEDLARAALAFLEIGVRHPTVQVLGGTVIVDLEGVTLKHISMFTATAVHQILCFLGLALPVRCHSLHVINYSWMLNTTFYFFKRFVPQDLWDTTHFHGYDMKSLQSHIDLDCLPPRYGGTCRSYADFTHWLKKIKQYRTEQFDEDMKQLGYVIKE